MSRIGKEPVEIPSGVELKIDGMLVTAKGKLGEQAISVTEDVELSHDGALITVKPANNGKRARMMWGTTRSQLQNLVTGVTDGFTNRLEIHGVGYRAAVQGKTLNLQLGFSHDVDMEIPDGVTVTVEKNTELEISGPNKGQIGQFCAEICKLRPPEPYKGKGVRYKGEQILRKEGKKK